MEMVSILSQPEGRELHRMFGQYADQFWFQSSPSPKAGSYAKLDGDSDDPLVSILSQPEGRELLLML